MRIPKPSSSTVSPSSVSVIFEVGGRGFASAAEKYAIGPSRRFEGCAPFMIVASYPAPAMMPKPFFADSPSSARNSISAMSKSSMIPARSIFASAWGSLGAARFSARRFAVPAGKGMTGIPVPAREYAVVVTVPSPPLAMTASKSRASVIKLSSSVVPSVERRQTSSPSAANDRTKS